MTADRILVCDPNPQVQRALRVILRDAGYQVLTTGSGSEALACVAHDRPRAVILELALPDLDGLEFCRWLRHYGQMPILVLSAVDQENTKIQALESGADDYVTKPFSSGELLARLAARLRSAPSELRFDIDGLVIDLPAHLVTIDGEVVHLTATEFALLRVLATSRGIVTHRVLAAGVWGSLRGDVLPRIRAHIMHLRTKLDRGRHSSVIRTEPGIGYRFVSDGPGQSVPGAPAPGSAPPPPDL